MKSNLLGLHDHNWSKGVFVYWLDNYSKEMNNWTIYNSANWVKFSQLHPVSNIYLAIL